MRTLIVTEEKANKRIDRILKETFSNMPQSAMYKAFRKKDIKVNGTRVKEDYVVKLNDKVDIYIVDEILDGASKAGSYTADKAFSVVYEDKNILIANKKQGIPVHPDKDQTENTLIDLVRDYIKNKGEYRKNSTFAPSLCHRLDRNTGGLIMIAKNEESLGIILRKIKTGEIKKYYQCMVKGRMNQKEGLLKAFLEKDENKSRVFIKDTRTKKSVEILTKYKVLSYEEIEGSDEGISVLEVELLTGRTHQIRAHFAYIGHPIAGDGKYGSNSFNRLLGIKYQALWAYKLKFDFDRDSGILNYLKGKEFKVQPEFETRKPNKHI
ncbi:MAG: RluA family pseudouridine synthase [Bacillota bacterium]